MGSSRKVTYASVQRPGYSKAEYTTADTWGQLKRDFPEIGAMAEGMTAWGKRTEGNDEGSSLSSDHQMLPPTDFTIYFLLEKNKSGVEEVVAAVDEWMRTNKEVLTLHNAGLEVMDSDNNREDDGYDEHQGISDID